MPPHVTEIIADERIVVRGYSLGYCDLDEELKLVDLETGEPVPIDRALTQDHVGKRGGPPGSMQVRCEIIVTPREALTPGRRYRVELLGDSLELTG